MSLSPIELVDRVSKIFDAAREGVGVCSFGGDPREVSMWSHYARDHTGVCLIFEVARDPAVFFEAMEVSYSGERPVYNWLRDVEGHRLVESLLTKHERWRCEAESRIVRMHSARTSLSFRAEALVGLIFGSEARDVVDGVQALLRERSAAGFPALRLYRAHKDPAGYGLSIRAADTFKR